jgi:hypothetical protein
MPPGVAAAASQACCTTCQKPSFLNQHASNLLGPFLAFEYPNILYLSELVYDQNKYIPNVEPPRRVHIGPISISYNSI